MMKAKLECMEQDAYNLIKKDYKKLGYAKRLAMKRMGWDFKFDDAHLILEVILCNQQLEGQLIDEQIKHQLTSSMPQEYAKDIILTIERS